ncbi:hypothetical protein GIB67_011732 [Kingdonia uniflora]|uniref:Uncharacterized protein n=1 Tax=Kingdonia uniflora TaxID=39325 RepID=A0A7J7LUQ6_9MAGN|nr:hypothetical protein GIB67_011732 [Kingdonia uniflora]
MVKTHSQRAVEVRVLNDMHLAFKIDEIREAVFGQEEIINEDRDIASGLLKVCGAVGYTGGKDKKKAVTRSLHCKLREEAEIEEVLQKLYKLSKLVRTNATDFHSGVKGFVESASCKVDPLLYISMVLTSGCTKADEVDLVGHLSPVIGVGDEEDTVAELVEWPHLKGSRVEYPTGSSRFRKFSQFDYRLTLPLSNLAKSVMNRIGACPAQLNFIFWEVILVCETLNERWAAYGSKLRIAAKDFLEIYTVKYVTATDGAYISSSSSRPCSFDLSSAGRVWNDNLLWVSGECIQCSNEEPLEVNNRTITKGINCKVSWKESFIDNVAREHTELEAILKKLEISRFKRVASKDDKVRRSQVKRRMAVKTSGSMEEKLTTPELNTLLKLARLNKMPDGPVDMATISSTVVRNLAKMKAAKREAASCSAKSDSVDDNSKGRKVTSPTKSQVVLEESDKIAEGVDLRQRFEVEAGKLYQLRYTKAEIMAFSEGNYKEKEIMDEEEVEEMEVGLNVAEKTSVSNQETINQKELDIAREREEQTLFYNVKYAEEYEALISQYEDRLDDNVKLSLKLEEAKRQVEDKTNNFEQEFGFEPTYQLDRLKADLRHLKGREAQGRADLAEIQAKNKSWINDLALARGNVKRDVQHLKFKLDKCDGEISSGEGSREMKKFLRRKKEFVENIRIDLTNSRQKSIDLTRQMSERIDQLTAELAESKDRRLKDNKHAVVTHQAFKELVVHEQEKCYGEALHQQKLSALIAFFCRGNKIPTG